MSRFLLSTAPMVVAASVIPIHAAAGDPWADAVISYRSGTGFATDFSTGAGYIQPQSILGRPSTVTPGQFGGPVDPFSPPYQLEQLLSIGEGGSVVVHMGRPVQNSTFNPFGTDFLVFGSAGFVITNGDFTGGGVTDGSLFSNSEGGTRVSVSQDGSRFFQLDPARAPVFDSLFPTDGQGSPLQPVNPGFAGSTFAGQGLEGIRRLYAGSAGGTGYDLSWAVDEQGRSVHLEFANYIRLDVLSGSAEIDAITVVPEPSSLLIGVMGATVGLLSGGTVRRSLRRRFSREH